MAEKNQEWANSSRQNLKSRVSLRRANPDPGEFLADKTRQALIAPTMIIKANCLAKVPKKTKPKFFPEDDNFCSHNKHMKNHVLTSL